MSNWVELGIDKELTKMATTPEGDACDS